MLAGFKKNHGNAHFAEKIEQRSFHFFFQSEYNRNRYLFCDLPVSKRIANRKNGMLYVEVVCRSNKYSLLLELEKISSMKVFNASLSLTSIKSAASGAVLL